MDTQWNFSYSSEHIDALTSPKGKALWKGLSKTRSKP